MVKRVYLSKKAKGKEGWLWLWRLPAYFHIVIPRKLLEGGFQKARDLQRSKEKENSC